MTFWVRLKEPLTNTISWKAASGGGANFYLDLEMLRKQLHVDVDKVELLHVEVGFIFLYCEERV